MALIMQGRPYSAAAPWRRAAALPSDRALHASAARPQPGVARPERGGRAPFRLRSLRAGWLNQVRTCSCHFFLKCWLGTWLLCFTILPACAGAAPVRQAPRNANR